MNNAAAATENKPYFDQRINAPSIFVLPGHHYVQKSGPVAVSTLLGSCVAACIRDKESEVGGLNHFLLPEAQGGQEQSARYGVNAMEVLINDILKTGASKSNLVAKIFGGANVIATKNTNTVGDQNGRFVKAYLEAEGIPILAEDLGGSRARRVYFFPATGRASVLSVAPSDKSELQASEAKLQTRFVEPPKSGGVELF